MLNLFKKSYSLIAPISGKTIDLSSVPDEVFAQKLAGDGIAIESTGDVIVAPADGILTLIFRTNHAVGITLDNGIEVLIHIGIDTVELEGRGFERIAKEGDMVRTGDPIIKIDRDMILSSGFSLITPILLTNMDSVNSINPSIGKDVTAGKDAVLSYTVK